MRIKPTLSGFLKFCRAQPEDTTINNRNWSVCAFGTYLQGCGITYAPSTSHPGLNIKNLEHRAATLNFENELKNVFTDPRHSMGERDKGDDTCLYERLNSGGYSTYGELQFDTAHLKE